MNLPARSSRPKKLVIAISPRISVWVAKSEAGAFDDEVEASNLLTDYEGRIAVSPAAFEDLHARQGVKSFA